MVFITAGKISENSSTSCRVRYFLYFVLICIRFIHWLAFGLGVLVACLLSAVFGSVNEQVLAPFRLFFCLCMQVVQPTMHVQLDLTHDNIVCFFFCPVGCWLHVDSVNCNCNFSYHAVSLTLRFLLSVVHGWVV